MSTYLENLQAMLQSTTISATIEDSILFADHGEHVTVVESIDAANQDPEAERIQEILLIKTKFSGEIKKAIKNNSQILIPLVNRFASLGAVFIEKDEVFLGSRLTIFEGDDAWPSLQLPLCLFTIIASFEGTRGALIRDLKKQDPIGGESNWTQDDFQYTKDRLSQLSFCNISSSGLVAEFSLREGEISAITGSNATSLLKLRSDQPHPELGGGLFCLLEMPHRITDKAKLLRLSQQLNLMEMAANDLPPHFGAWCEGSLGNNLAYVSFLPNPLHDAYGIALNYAIWSLNRSRWANAMLISLGVSID